MTSEEQRIGHARIKGRWWRTSDPTIPESLRQALVNALMAARRGVAAGQRADDPDAVARARQLVHAAKVALGERGPKWWLPCSREEQIERADATVYTLLAHREAEATACPSEIARIIGAADWRNCMALVRERAVALQAEGVLRILQGGQPVNGAVRGPVRLGRGPAFTGWDPRRSSVTRQ